MSTAEETLKSLYKEAQHAKEFSLGVMPWGNLSSPYQVIKCSYNGGVFLAPEHIDLIANLVVERLRGQKDVET